MKCSKCLTPDCFVVSYTDLTTNYHLCSICNRAYDKPAELIAEFIKDDFGKFPIGEIDKRIIEARKRRAMGESPWMPLPAPPKDCCQHDEEF